MSLPTPTNTWTISANNTQLTNGATNTDSNGRRRDIADFLGVLVSQLITLGGAGISCVGSSDGVTNSPGAGPPTLNATNLWVPGSTDFRNTIQNLTAYSFSINAVWCILQFGVGQIAFAVSSDASGGNPPHIWSIYWSPAGLFAAPVNRFWRPVAPDEQVMSYWDTTSSGGIFNQDTLGIVNTANSYTSYTQQIHVGLGVDGAGGPTSFWAVSYHAFFPGFLIWFGGLDNGLVGTIAPFRDWSAAKACFTSGNFAQRNLVGPYGDAAGLQLRSTYQPNGLRAVMPSTQNFDNGTNGSNYQSVAYNPVIYNSTPDFDSGLLPVLPIGAYSHDYKGIKGLLSDVWFGASQGNANVYPASGPIQFVQINDCIFPWNVAASAPLFT